MPPPTTAAHSAAEDHELVPVGSPMARSISVNPARMHGEPCFVGTRVPVAALFDHLRAGDPLAEFLRGFPEVSEQAAVAVIDLAAAGLLSGLRGL
jgi:uncharacterized protein (DUF433 family)